MEEFGGRDGGSDVIIIFNDCYGCVALYVTVFAAKPDALSLPLGTHIAGENGSQQAVSWPPGALAHAHILNG